MSLVRAGREARRFVEGVRRPQGMYRIERWPQVRPGRGSLSVGSAVVALRTIQRTTLGFLDPVEDALYLVAGLRALGVPVSFHLGRELVPVAAPAGYYAWVQHVDEVLSTSLPVLQTYVEIHRVEAG
ncbi:hypothetical protein [Actinokineospora diospyrosa]|uniref:Transglutaminase superfamily protein n=1 Tax=Actinokineospora diospyrosa TaxID=103728 RepID=A0ABT1IJF4_9PSEU|nr:hypothetical protein [Actinokineospora diospyrosa]MCP2272673.1 hypothetical protein [Actinokineospora diospyrosa]